MGILFGIGNTKPTYPYDNYYGIEWDDTVAVSSATRIGRQELHAELPIQSRMKRCLLNDLGEVTAYLDPSDSTQVEGEGAATLDGSQGQVMVELPEHYRRFEKNGTKNRCLISLVPLPGFQHVPKAYRSAYQATVERGVNKLSSVVNTTPEFRGCGNQSAWDGTYRSALGLPATGISLTNYRNYARNRGAAGKNGAGWNCDLYELQKTTFWLYAVEYANFNSQLAFNAALTGQGYRQGGLGDGVTTLISADWTDYNGRYPFIPCGYTNSLGNNTGVVPFTMPDEYGSSLTVDVPSYRGLENPFGHIWHWTDGIRARYTTEEEGNLGEIFVQLDPAKFNSENLADYAKRGTLPPTGGYIKTMIVGEFGENMPATVGGSSTTYFADNHYQPTRPPENQLIRGVYFGGTANTGAYAGLSCSYTDYPVSAAHTAFGSRLCFLP